MVKYGVGDNQESTESLIIDNSGKSEEKILGLELKDEHMMRI